MRPVQCADARARGDPRSGAGGPDEHGAGVRRDEAPWWRRFEIWFPLAVYAATRIFTVIVVLICQRSQIALPAPNGILRIMYPTDGAPGYWVVMGELGRPVVPADRRRGVPATRCRWTTSARWT